MADAMQWERAGPGDWHLYDKPRNTPRERLSSRPVAWLSGFARIGYHGGIGTERNAQFHGRTIPQVKRQIMEALTPIPA